MTTLKASRETERTALPRSVLPARRGHAARASLPARPAAGAVPGAGRRSAALAVMVTTSGGLVAGDRLDIAVDVGAGRRRACHRLGGGENLPVDRRDHRNQRSRLSVEAAAGSNSCRPRRSCSTAPGCAAKPRSSLRPVPVFSAAASWCSAAGPAARASPAAFCTRSGKSAATVRWSGAMRCTSTGRYRRDHGRPGLLRRRRRLRDADPGAAAAIRAAFVDAARAVQQRSAVAGLRAGVTAVNGLAGRPLARRRRRGCCAGPMPISLAICAPPRWDCRRGCRGSGTFDARGD